MTNNQSILIIFNSRITAASADTTYPYELPEIITVPLVAGLPAYLAWIKQTTAPI